VETGEGHLEGPIRFTCESTPVLILILVAFLCVLLLLVVSSPSRSDERRNPSFEFFSLFLSGVFHEFHARALLPRTERRTQKPEEPRRTQKDSKEKDTSPKKGSTQRLRSAPYPQALRSARF
jgi:hypothetical protein